jgi:hypothetical protein
VELAHAILASPAYLSGLDEVQVGRLEAAASAAREHYMGPARGQAIAESIARREAAVRAAEGE